MHPNYIKKIIQIEDVIIKKVSQGLSSITFFMLETKPKVHICPKCGSSTSRVHDYRYQRIKHIPFGINSSILILKKRRYTYPCGKRFYENYSWLPRYQRMTRQLIMYICHQLRETVSYTHVAKQANVSIPTVIRTFNRISYPKPTKMPKVLCIDEFRGNAETGKFQCILVNGARKHEHVIDILPDRRQSHLYEYFLDIPRNERLKTKFFVTDMREPYRDIAKTFFKSKRQR